MISGKPVKSATSVTGMPASLRSFFEPPVVYAPAVPRAYGYSVEDTDAVAYCSRRFRSYNPETGTYIASGGVVRACP